MASVLLELLLRGGKQSNGIFFGAKSKQIWFFNPQQPAFQCGNESYLPFCSGISGSLHINLSWQYIEKKNSWIYTIRKAIDLAPESFDVGNRRRSHECNSWLQTDWVKRLLSEKRGFIRKIYVAYTNKHSKISLPWKHETNIYSWPICVLFRRIHIWRFCLKCDRISPRNQRRIFSFPFCCCWLAVLALVSLPFDIDTAAAAPVPSLLLHKTSSTLSLRLSSCPQ